MGKIFSLFAFLAISGCVKTSMAKDELDGDTDLQCRVTVDVAELLGEMNGYEERWCGPGMMKNGDFWVRLLPCANELLDVCGPWLVFDTMGSSSDLYFYLIDEDIVWRTCRNGLIGMIDTPALAARWSVHFGPKRQWYGLSVQVERSVVGSGSREMRCGSTLR